MLKINCSLKFFQALYHSTLRQQVLQPDLGLNPAVEGKILYITFHSEQNFPRTTKYLEMGKLSGLSSEPL